MAQNGNTTVNGDIYATNTQFNGPNTLTLTDLSDINGNVTTTANNQGILALQGTTAVTGTIGAAGFALNAINLLGLNKTLTIDGNTFANNINIANDGFVVIQNNANFNGNINNTSGVDNKGTLTFEGTGSVSGTIGSSNTLKLITVNALGGNNKTVTLSGNVVRSTNINVNDDGATATTLKLDNPTMVLTTGIITPATPTLDFFDINQAALVNAQIGTLVNNFATVRVASLGPTVINGSIFAGNTQFQADNKLSLTDGSNVTGRISTVAPNFGTLELRGNHTITGSVQVGTINVIGPGKTVNFQQPVSSGSGNLNFAPGATCATTINFSNNANVTGNIDNTTLSGNAGTLNFLGNSAVTDMIGVTNPICKINLGAAASTVSLQKNVNVGSGNINFTQDSVLQIGLPGTTANVNANIDNLTGLANKGTLSFLGSSTMNGTIGATNPLFLVNLSSPGGDTVNFAKNVNAQTVRFTAGGLATVADGITISGPITTTAAGQGDLNFLGNFTVNNQIGTAGNPLNSINLAGASGSTVSLLNNIYATNTNVGSGNVLAANVGGLTIGGTVNLGAAGGTIAVASIAAPVNITGDLNVPANTVMQIDLNNVAVPTYIAVAGNANISANSTLKLTNTPKAYAAGLYNIKVVDANGGAIAAPPVIADSLLLTYKAIADNVNHDLLLQVDVLPASQFANRINTVGVAGALDEMAGQNFLGSLQDLLNQLPFFSSQQQFNDALAALAPIVDGSYTQEMFAAQQLGYGAVSDRLRHVRQRKMLPGMKAPFETGIASGDDWDDNGHGRWFKLYGQYSDQNEREQVAGYNAETWGMAIGSDVSLNDLNLIGVSANLSHTYIGHDVSDSKSSVYSLQAALYGEQDFCEWFYFNWVTSVAYNKYTTERNFQFGLLPFSPKDDFNGWQFGSKGELGYEYLYKGLHIIPNTTLYYSYLALSSFNESGAGTASQSVDSQHYSMLKGGLGVRAAYNCPYNMGDRHSLIFQPELRVNMFYDFINDNMSTTSQFTGGGPSFVTVGFTPAPTSYNLGASLSVFSDFSNYIVTISYDHETKSDYTANAGFVRMRYEW